MNKAEFLKQAKQAVALLKRYKRDPRYVRTVGLLVTKGFLHTNRELPRMPNVRVNIEDAIWAGKNVEPRILDTIDASAVDTDFLDHSYFANSASILHDLIKLVIDAKPQAFRIGERAQPAAFRR